MLVKKLNLDDAYKQFDQINLKINPDFLDHSFVNPPVLQEIKVLLEAIPEKGLKLTAKGNLPTKLVESITLTSSSLRAQKYLKWTKRFLEEEQLSAIRARTIVEVGGLIKKRNNKLYLTRKGKEYLQAANAEQMILVYYVFLGLNLGYFDGYQNAPFINNISYIMLQLVRDKSRQYRTTNVYCELLVDDYEQIHKEIESTLVLDTILDDDLFELFIRMTDVRLFQHFFLPLGFVQERGDAFDKSVEYQKSELLDCFLQPLDAIDKSKVLNTKLIKVFQKRIQIEKLEIDLFNDFCFLFSNYIFEPAPSPQMLANDIVRQKALIGTAKDAQLSFYIDLCECIKTTMLQFTELDALGSGEHLMDDYKSIVDGFYALLSKTTSYNLFMDMQAIIYFMFEMLKTHYKINAMESDFYDSCVETFNSEIAEDIESVIFLMGELQKQTKKVKKIKPKIADLTKEVIHSYILALLQLRAFNKDSI